MLGEDEKVPPVTWPLPTTGKQPRRSLWALAAAAATPASAESARRRLSKNDNSQRPCEIKFGRLLSACYQAFMVPFPAGT